ncbi:MAG: Nif3-like dinuclear metal center hexameric protein [Deltaproteobacteria bacterium]|jgi:dinuclear metal center YbgI/SA1388 family protein|nr:Nif3-like dinuclear metal center hexameric protein [Deltaproteobacteria bacterium]
MKVKDFLYIIDRIAPFQLALDWDNSGLQVGNLESSVERAALALDPSLPIICQAVAQGCQLLITHHPLIFKPLKTFDLSNPQAAQLAAAISGSLAVISAHTNWDAKVVAEELADLLQVERRRPLEDRWLKFLKVVVFVPESHEEAVRQAVLASGAGTIGEYTDCFFKSNGLGGFKVPPDGRPFSGEPGLAHQTDEVRLEIITPINLMGLVDQAVRSVHPYEEPAFEFYELKTSGHGFGLIGSWDPPREAAPFLKAQLSSDGFWAGPKPGLVSSVALMPGSGGNYVQLAYKAGAQLLVSGEITHHQALLAEELGLSVFAAGHFETERPGLDRLAGELANEFRHRQERVELINLEEKSPFYRL